MPSDALTDRFRAELPAALQRYLIADEDGIFRVPGASPDVGDLVVWNDGSELTVGVGNITHNHFSPWFYVGLPPGEQMRLACAAAIEWIEAIVSDQVRFRVEYEGDRVVAASSWTAEQGDGGPWLRGTTRVVEFRWSGRKNPS